MRSLRRVRIDSSIRVHATGDTGISIFANGREDRGREGRERRGGEITTNCTSIKILFSREEFARATDRNIRSCFLKWRTGSEIFRDKGIIFGTDISHARSRTTGWVICFLFT